MNNFDSILVANRGEIACRVIRSAQQQGFRAIAVYSEADATARHVRLADEAVLIGAAPVKESYLDSDNILAAAKKTGAQAIHPGYGFLSENAAFADACEAAGLVFIGPSAESIDIMGNKAASKRRMLEADVPCIPGYQSEDQSDETLLAAARDIGVPIMVKAAAGGGGKGMRLVERLEDLELGIASARSEAESAFGSGELILEKAVMQPRHVEIQVFGDTHGNVIHLGERDCSVQRRHQKVIEESPCPVMTPELREAMGTAAMNAARSINYCGAGTVEFLLDSDNNFYFLEMNTRLQVEHPVTEMVTGQDLVALQFLVAQGYPLPLQQSDIELIGHAIEVRLYAEDPGNDFLPATGTAAVWQAPEGEGVRVDHGLLTGQEISPFYDPMIAKIIAWGEDRNIARRRLVQALNRTCLFGVENNREFLIDVLQKEAFANGSATTAFIEENYNFSEEQSTEADLEMVAISACLQYRVQQGGFEQQLVAPIMQLSGWRSSSRFESHFVYELDDDGEHTADVLVREPEENVYDIVIGETTYQLQWLEDISAHSVRLLVNGVQKTVHFAFPDKGQVSVQVNGVGLVLTNQLSFTKGDMRAAGSGAVLAPMHGNILAVNVSEGDKVEVGQLLAVMEAMKMEHRLVAQVEGEVAAIHAEVGQQIEAESMILQISEV